jgi:hypothetical protein
MYCRSPTEKMGVNTVGKNELNRGKWSESTAAKKSGVTPENSVESRSATGQRGGVIQRKSV